MVVASYSTIRPGELASCDEKRVPLIDSVILFYIFQGVQLSQRF